MSLPIDAILPELLPVLERHRRAVLVAPPGAGKTTRVPLALLDAPWLSGRRIVMLEPRRLAARAAAAWMARSLGEAAGETVGYRVRFETRVGSRTRIEVVTEGILTRMLQGDPGLDGIGLVIFDEFHERSLAADTGLALTLATRDLLRPDLAVLVMSATIDGAAVAELLDQAPVIESKGRAFPVETRHRPPRQGQWIEPHVAAVVREALAAEPGSVLAFLAGAGEIRRVEELLRSNPLPTDVTVHALHGAMPFEAQEAAIAPAPPGRRKVVLATNIAETSLTIEGVRQVVDSGWMRLPRFSPRTGMTRLDTVRISRAAADQRRGRAGRTEPGVCWRCWHAHDEAGLVPWQRPEILEADLAPLALDLAAAGFPDPGALRWLDPPPGAGFRHGRELLHLLGAMDGCGALTAHGRAMAAFGAHPRLAHLLVRARAAGGATLDRAAALVALVEERDPIRGEGGPPPADITLRVDAIERNLDTLMLAGAALDGRLVARLRDMAQAWRRRAGAAAPGSDEAEPVGRLLAWAWPDRVAQQRGGAGRFVLRNGRGASLPPTDALATTEWLAVAELDDTGREARIALAAPVELDWLRRDFADDVATEEVVSWDEVTQRVLARRRTMLGALTLADRAASDVNPGRIRAVLLETIRQRGIDWLPWTDSASRVRQRLAFLHAHDASWPDVGDAALLMTLEAWLEPFLDAAQGRTDLARVPLGEALLRALTWEQRRAFEVRAPDRLEVPSGSWIAVDYAEPDAPALPVRLQEVFGLLETPRLDGVPLTMRLLSPAYRPVQVTRDLASFWRQGYFDVRKDLRGRYPKHHWPEDPLTATATKRAKRKT